MNVCAWGYALPKPCVDGQWKEGNPSNDGAFREGDFVPFQAVFRPDGSHPIRPGQTYTLRIGYDIARGGLVAYDYLGTYNPSQPDRAIGGNPAPDIVPCSGAGVTTQGPNACGHPPSTTAVPPDPRTTFLSGGNPPTSREFSAWGVHLDSAAQVVCGNQGTIPVIDANTGIPGGPQPRCIDLRFTAEGNGTAPVGAVIAWGGHIATVADWGAGRTYALSGGGGAQFHMRLQASSSFNLGHEEISLRTIGRPAGFITSVTPRVIHPEDTVIDTATLTGRNGAYPRGDVAFFVCGPTTTATSCTSGGRSAGHDEPVVQQGSSIVGTATIKFPSVEAPAPGGLEPGFYCFRAEYTPGLLSPFLPATHTNATTECFRVVTEPLKTLRLEKVCEPPGHFDLHIQSATTFSHTFANVPCNGGDEISVPAGTYTVSESASAGTNPADFDPPVFGSTCLNGSVTITAADTEPVTCTITNFRTAEPRATLTVKKECQPADDAGVFVVLIGTARYDLRCGEDTGTVDSRPERTR